MSLETSIPATQDADLVSLLKYMNHLETHITHNLQRYSGVSIVTMKLLWTRGMSYLSSLPSGVPDTNIHRPRKAFNSGK